jgi:hypothetical protein
LNFSSLIKLISDLSKLKVKQVVDTVTGLRTPSTKSNPFAPISLVVGIPNRPPKPVFIATPYVAVKPEGSVKSFEPVF